MCIKSGSKMSRLIVKNLPNNITNERFKEVFAEIGHLTDCCLKYTKDGKFRNFGFVGFETELQARGALKMFNNTYIDSRKIQVEIARDLADPEKPRPWSKYSKESSAYKLKELAREKTESKESSEKLIMINKASKKKSEADGDGDPGFEEFLKAQRSKDHKAVWSDEIAGSKKGGLPSDKDSLNNTDKEVATGDGDELSNKNYGEQLQPLSDLEFLKKKFASQMLTASDSYTSDEDEDEIKDTKTNDTNLESSKMGKKVKVATESDKESRKSKKKKKKIKQKLDEEEANATIEQQSEVFRIKMRGLPFTVKEKMIKEFFSPVKPKNIHIPHTRSRSTTGVAFVDFGTNKEVNQAMKKHKNFMGERYVELFKQEKKLNVDFNASINVQAQRKPWEEKVKKLENEEAESVAESGRLFLRNLSYTCTEEDLENLFGKYGPLSEVSLPVDSLLKKIKGFGFVTYMLPEHAVKAYSELDGTVLKGRMLHIIPAVAKKTEALEITDDMTYKQKQEIKKKQIAASSHNWNSLFLGSNAVVDLMTDKYNTSKDAILSAESKDSIAVRLALGETQIVLETRDFLQSEGVCLDAFSQPAAPRSKTVILVKNLPAGTTASELRDALTKFGGDVTKIVIPPRGVTAIAEFASAADAKFAFTKLAYTRFKYLPLYLEWAPVGVFKVAEKNQPDPEKQEEKTKIPGKINGEVSSEDEEEPEDDSTVFVKNLNFNSTEETLREVFSKCGKLFSVSIATKKDLKNPGKTLSMGYGFVQYMKNSDAMNSIKKLQHKQVDDHALELKLSQRATKPLVIARKKASNKKQKSAKILVKNIPFEAKTQEVKQLFSTFGDLKVCRLPKRLTGTGSHRGFGFVEFMTRHDAKRAFKALCHSTHLYGRRLVLEWADADDTVEQLRKRTAQHFHDEDLSSKRLKKSSLKHVLERHDKDESD